MNPLVFMAGLTGLNMLTSSIQNQYTQQMNRQNWREQWKMWHATNEYNTPEAQMARLKAAGLNPNLVYGQGTVGNASNQQLPKGEPNIAPDLSSVLPSFYDVQVKNAQLENLNADLVNKTLMASKIAADTAGKEFDTALKTELKQTSIDVAKEALKNQQLSNVRKEIDNLHLPSKWKLELEKAAQSIAYMKTQMNYVQLQSHAQRMANELRKQGVEVSDNLFFRLIAPLLPSQWQMQQLGKYIHDPNL